MRASFDRTHRWERRSLNEHLKNRKQQAIYAVIHGGMNFDLRKESCSLLTDLPFNGFAIGGSVGKNRQELKELIAFTRPLLPSEYPTHLLGIGDLDSLNALIPHGIDTFDSSYPTKAARHGTLLTRQGQLKIEQGKYAQDFTAIDPDCTCLACSSFSRAYLHHLFKAKELTAYSLASIHNLAFMVDLMKDIRERILQDEI